MRAEARAPGGYEMDVEGAEILQKVSETDPYPITPKDHGVDFLMDHRHLWLRSQRQHAIIRVRHEVIKGSARLFRQPRIHAGGYADFHARRLRGNHHPFRSELLRRRKAYLTQSGQLYNEANAMAFGKVYCFGPTFRAEKSKTRRHLTEFWMVEPEMAYADLEEIKRVAEEMVIYVVGRVLENAARGTEGAGAGCDEAGSGAVAVSAHELRRGGEKPSGTRLGDSVGQRFRRRRTKRF